jgi:hypothetical protein
MLERPGRPVAKPGQCSAWPERFSDAVIVELNIANQASSSARIVPLMVAFNALVLMTIKPQVRGHTYLRSERLLVL